MQHSLHMSSSQESSKLGSIIILVLYIKKTNSWRMPEVTKLVIGTSDRTMWFFPLHDFVLS